ncbi:MAG: extracellular solute-binding protein [Candidatus Tectomicrobia bacterium]|nr:extracellular solute-binding protein [Candidatus Tectomicrobia bacterium]
MKKGRFLGVALTVSVLLMAFLSYGQTAAPPSSLEDKVVVYSPHGKDILAEFEKFFEESYPGVDVQWLDMGSQDVLDRIRSEKANPQGDIWWGAPSSMFDAAAKEGLLKPYKPSWSDKVKETFRHPEYYWYGTFQTPEVIMYNNQLLTEKDAPKDWDELLDPKWKDKVIIRYPLASGTMRTIYAAMIYRFYKKTGKPDEGYEWLKKLDANTKSYAANPTILNQKLARGEGMVTLWNMPGAVFDAKVNGYPLGFIVPKSGTPVLTDAMAIIANSKHPKAAEAFYEFVTSLQSSVLLAHEHYRIPTRSDIPEKSLPKWISETKITPMEIDWKVMGEKEAEWMKYWDENIKEKGRK